MWGRSQTSTGVTIDYQLKFDKHVSDICKKSSRQLNVLKHIGKQITKLGRLSTILSTCQSFIYCPVIWHFWGEVNTYNWSEWNFETAAKLL